MNNSKTIESVNTDNNNDINNNNNIKENIDPNSKNIHYDPNHNNSINNNQNEDQFNQIKLEYIKSYLDSHLENMGVYNKLLKQFNSDSNSNIGNNEEQIMSRIKEEGIVDDIIENLGKWGEDNNINSSVKQTQKGMFLKLSHATDFTDFIKPDPDVKVIIDILFLGQRYQSKAVFAHTDMNFDQGFFLDFNPTKLDVSIDLDNLLRLSSLIHITVMSITDGSDSYNKSYNNNNNNNNNNSNEIRTILATKTLEWRWILSYGSWKINTELFSYRSSTNKTTIGNLNFNISLLPMINKKQLLPEKTVFNHINSEKRYMTQTHQDFVKYANDWWEDFKNIRKNHVNRLIKIFLNTEDKENYCYKPACCLLFPITSGRAISTPYEAARFVSLIPYSQNIGVNNSKEEIYNSMHSFLSVKKGDVEDHCILLCNILLGFGLDAYIAIGLSINGPHTWVITRGVSEVVNNNSSSGYNKNTKIYSITFWESLTGQRINISDPKVFRFYKKIHSVFSDSSFYANIQPDDTVFNTSYVFEDEFLWKSIPKDKIEALVKFDYTPELTLTNVITDIHKKEILIEKELKTKMIQFRKTIDLGTQFDAKLSYLLAPALCNYELERVSNSTFGNEEFKQSIKNYVPEGYTFKAFPCHESCFDTNVFFSLIMSSDIGKDIMYTRGDNVRIAVRCKIYQYPQDIMSCWVMISVKYRPIK